MAKLTDLPTELLQMIATAEGYFDEILKERDLARLSVVNRQLHNATNRIFFSYGIHKGSNPPSYAARHGNVHILKAMVAFRLEPTYWHYVLLEACVNGHLNIVTWILDRGIKLEDHGMPLIGDSDYRRHNWLISSSDWQMDRGRFYELPVLQEGCVALKVAIDELNQDIVLFLLSHGANPFFVTKEGKSISALHQAARANMVKVVEYLIQKTGLSVDLPDYRGLTPLRYAVKYSYNRDRDTEMLEKLIELGANVNSEVRGELPLTSALSRAKYKHASMLLDAGSKIVPDKPLPRVRLPIHALIYGSKGVPYKCPRQIALLHRIVDAGADLQKKYTRGHTPLREALLHGSESLLSHLLRILGEEQPHPDDLLDVLVWAYKDVHHFPRKVEVVLKWGARMDTVLSNGQTFLFWVIRNSTIKTDFLDKLLTKATDAMLDRGYLDDLLVELTSSANGVRDSYDFSEILYEHGARIKSLDHRYNVSLYTISAHRTVQDWLIEGFDMLPTEKMGLLFIGAMERNFEKLAYNLLDLIEPNISELDPRWLYEAARLGLFNIITRLLKYAKSSDLNVVQESTTVLAMLVYNTRDYECALEVMEHGANPILPTNHPVCDGRKFRYWYRITPRASAFEIGLHQGIPFEVIQKMWQKIDPEARPDPKAFIRCVCNEEHKEGYHSEVVAWLEKLTVKDDKATQDEGVVQEV
ncbi:ankyrin repeat protein [Daldinia childiae]|uniref:ankyrin repeat protein n=1 Tax=Daldinia childiae TaxID=326645 RepID=UPI0014475BED|nr:ankyrin repeat protein [Daldinia childiae]KAF3065063.1 ankyrin repeat protein [Daldinia childiae]